MAENPVAVRPIQQLATRPARNGSVRGMGQMSDWNAGRTFTSSVAISAFGFDSRPSIAVPEMNFASEDDCAVIVVDSRRRLHSFNKNPAIKFSDGREIFYWHGVEVPDFVIKNPETITLQHIQLTGNSEVRRVLIEKYGAARYLLESGAKRISGDSFGELYKLKQKGDEDLVMVKVRNSTPEPDGSVKHYWLRVPPATRTAQEGVAWTFGMGPKEYKPAQET